MKKISIFYSCHNLGTWNLWEIIFKDLKMAHEGSKPLPEEVIFSFIYIFNLIKNYIFPMLYKGYKV